MEFKKFNFPQDLNWTESPVEAVRRVLPADSDCAEMTALLVGLLLAHQVDNPGMGDVRLFSASNSEDMELLDWGEDMELLDWNESRFDPEAWTYQAEDGTEHEVNETQVLNRILAGADPEARTARFDLSRDGFYFEGQVAFHEGALKDSNDRWVDVITVNEFGEGGSPTLFLYCA